MSAAVRVAVSNLSRSYAMDDNEQTVLADVSVDIHPGERIALLGPSGSGKSTLLNLIAGIDSPDSGEIRLDDFNITAASDRDRTLYRRRNIGFVFQSFNLVPTLTVRENVELPLLLGQDDAAGPGSTASQIDDRVSAVLSDVGVSQLERRFPDSLSGGEQQRIAVARAVVHRPGLILADEPTGNLDRNNAERVLELLMALTEDRGATLVLATHSREAAGLSQRVLSVRDHQLYESALSEL